VSSVRKLYGNIFANMRRPYDVFALARFDPSPS
jgi:hypothetical protein